MLFFIAWTVASPQIARFNDANCLGQSNCSVKSKLFSSDQQNLRTNPARPDKQKQLIAGGTHNKAADVTATEAQNDSMSGEMFGKKFTMSKTEFKTRLIHDFETYLPKKIGRASCRERV